MKVPPHINENTHTQVHKESLGFFSNIVISDTLHGNVLADLYMWTKINSQRSPEMCNIQAYHTLQFANVNIGIVSEMIKASVIRKYSVHSVNYSQ